MHTVVIFPTVKKKKNVRVLFSPPADCRKRIPCSRVCVSVFFLRFLLENFPAVIGDRHTESSSDRRHP